MARKSRRTHIEKAPTAKETHGGVLEPSPTGIEVSGGNRKKSDEQTRPAMTIHIGTSGWHYKHWIGAFYPPGLAASQMLAWYARRFDTVEINNSFYRLPPETALCTWRKTVPANFCFAVKGSRFITHMKKLKDPVQALEKFFRRAELLGNKLGPILFQLPPNWPLDADRLSNFLEALPFGHRYSFEFRNQTWHVEQVYRLLEKHNAAFCIFDLAGFTSPARITAGFAYVRLHGPGGKYQGSYDRQALGQWARKIEFLPVEETHVYFDNDERGFAARDAADLKQLLGSSARVETS